MKKHLRCLTVAGFLCALPAVAMAGPSYVKDFNALYPNATVLDCKACHTSAPSLNPYGSSFKAKHTGSVTTALALTQCEPLDSDGDGYTNLTEITATTTAAPVYPGVSTSIPKKLLFFDNFTNASAGVIPNWTKTSGAWTGDKKFVTSPPTGVALLVPGTKVAALNAFKAGTISSKVQLVKVTGTTPNAHIVFSELSAKAYRYVAVKTGSISIGQVGTVGGLAAGEKATASLTLGTTLHTVKVVTDATGWVKVYLDSATTVPAVSFKFPTAVAGKTGLLTSSAKAKFDEVSVSK